jgi:DNA-binding response OmpR family regulator
VHVLIVTRLPQRFQPWLTVLQQEGLQLRLASPDRTAMGQVLLDRAPEVALVDLVESGPALSGVRTLLGELCPGQEVPIVAVVSRGFLPASQEGVEDVVQVTAPPEEVVYRVQRVLERVRRRPPTLRLGDLVLHLAEQLVQVEGERIALRDREFELLRYLALRPNRVFRREELARQVWGEEFQGSLRTVDTHVYRLRTRLGSFGERHIQTVRGVGYRLSVSPG